MEKRWCFINEEAIEVCAYCCTLKGAKEKAQKVLKENNISDNIELIAIELLDTEETDHCKEGSHSQEEKCSCGCS